MEEAKSKKGGRPPKAAQDKKQFKIELKLTRTDFDKLDQQYQRSGYRNRSDMYYDMLFQQQLKQQDSATLLVLQEIQTLTREIKEIRRNSDRLLPLLQEQAGPGTTLPELQSLVVLTGQLQEKEQEMFQIIIKLRERWLRAS